MGSLFDDTSSSNTLRARSFEAVVTELSAVLQPAAQQYETVLTELHRQLAPQLATAERAFIEAARLAEPYGRLYIETATALDPAVRRHVAEPRSHRPPRPPRLALPRWMHDDGPDLGWRASLEDLADL